MSPRRQATADRTGPGTVPATPDAEAQAAEDAPRVVAAAAGQSTTTSTAAPIAPDAVTPDAAGPDVVTPDGGTQGDGTGAARPAWKRLPVRIPASQPRAQRGPQPGSQTLERSGADLPIRKPDSA